MRHLLFLLSVLIGVQACFQQGKSTHSDSSELFPNEYGTFEKYAFVVDGEIIEQQLLMDYPGAILNKVFPYDTTLAGHEYQGVLYFHTPGHPPVHPVPYADDPAYFVNGTQVSPFDVRSLIPEACSRIEKSTRDTTIGDKFYAGSLHVETDEDFFAKYIALPEFLERHTDLPLNQIIVDFRGSNYYDQSYVGTVIHDHFPIYHINPQRLQSVKIDHILTTDGERYVVQLIDNRYNKGGGIRDKGMWASQLKARSIFEDSATIGTDCPCYVSDFVDTAGRHVFHATELDPEPYQGVKVYLKKLSSIMGLPAEKPETLTVLDSIAVQFIVTRIGMLTGLEANVPDKPGHARILQAIKINSCPWSVGAFSGSPVMTKRKITIFYSKDPSGKIVSLDDLEYRYDK
ncbi:hypothetical protein [Parapedobacter sp. 10938]|uniref:hypothetical protein n=1 Tax=Parapedobacter flavus TaxID=3110225 RepID=UPI002DB651B0|nr:hypothetical protein [Parapedobacter sp. 10938]MEC3882080.1 hypothetical protein [Parapedobacter sp. 10938]